MVRETDEREGGGGGFLGRLFLLSETSLPHTANQFPLWPSDLPSTSYLYNGAPSRPKEAGKGLPLGLGAPGCPSHGTWSLLCSTHGGQRESRGYTLVVVFLPFESFPSCLSHPFFHPVRLPFWRIRTTHPMETLSAAISCLLGSQPPLGKREKTDAESPPVGSDTKHPGLFRRGRSQGRGRGLQGMWADIDRPHLSRSQG